MAMSRIAVLEVSSGRDIPCLFSMSHFLSHGHFMRVCGHFEPVSLMDLNYELSRGSLSSRSRPAGKKFFKIRRETFPL